MPIYATKLTAGLIENKLEEHHLNQTIIMAEKTKPIAEGETTVETTPVTANIEDEAADANLGNVSVDSEDAIKHKVAFTVKLAETGVAENGNTFFALRSQNFRVDGVQKTSFPWMTEGVETTSNRITKGWRCVLQMISEHPIGRMLIAKTKGHPSLYEGAEEIAVFMLTNMNIVGEVVIVPAGSVMFDGSISTVDAANFNIISYSLKMGALEQQLALELLKDLKKREELDQPLMLE